MPGLAAVQREATLDRLAIELREYSKLQSNAEDLLTIDSQVWKIQREHMRLLSQQAEMKAGETLVGLERDLLLEKEAAEHSKVVEMQLAADLGEKRVILAAENLAHTQVNKDLENIRNSESVIADEDEALMSEIKERQSEL